MTIIKPVIKSSNRIVDIAFGTLVTLSALMVLCLLGGIIISLFLSAWESIHEFGFTFLWSKTWDVPGRKFGALIPVYGTLITSLISIIIAVPVSLGIAFFLTELAPTFSRRPLKIVIELLAAIPSIVYGMWGLFVFLPLFSTYFQIPIANKLSSVPIIGSFFSVSLYGASILATGIILAIMIIPYISSVLCDIFEQTTTMMRESAYGVGCTTWEVFWNIIVPLTRNGVIGSVMLGLGRALGETMAVTFIIGNTYQLDNFSLFMAGHSITSVLANEFEEAHSALHTSALMELGLLLFLITFLVLLISKLMILRLGKSRRSYS
jgi:phosphate transport system permease protein